MKKLVSLLLICSSLFSSARTIWVCDNSITYRWDNGWKESTKSAYEYDSNGNTTQWLYYSWDNGWKNTSKYIYEHDANGNQTQYLSYIWNKDWINSSKQVSEYKSISIEGENNNINNDSGNEGNNNSTAISEFAANTVNIYVYGNTIVVENATDEIRVYNAMGALVCRDVACRVRAEITVNTTGIYIVKTGNVVKRIMVE